MTIWKVLGNLNLNNVRNSQEVSTEKKKEVEKPKLVDSSTQDRNEEKVNESQNSVNLPTNSDKDEAKNDKMEEDEPRKAEKVDADPESPKHVTLPPEDSSKPRNDRKSVKESQDASQPRDASRLSEMKEGFYENSFIDDKSDNEGEHRNSSLKSKPSLANPRKSMESGVSNEGN